MRNAVCRLHYLLGSISNEIIVSISLQYGLTRLKLQCESHLSTNLSATNVCELLVVADLHDSAFLRKEALQFLVNNANQVRFDLILFFDNP